MSTQRPLTRRGFVTTMSLAGTAVLAGTAAPAAENKGVTLALLGAAHMHTSMFLDILKTREDVKVAHVWDRDAARAEKFAGACGGKVAKSSAEVLADPGVDVVHLCTPNFLHYSMAKAALPVANQAKVVMVSPTSSSNELSSDSTILSA